MVAGAFFAGAFDAGAVFVAAFLAVLVAFAAVEEAFVAARVALAVAFVAALVALAVAFEAAFVAVAVAFEAAFVAVAVACAAAFFAGAVAFLTASAGLSPLTVALKSPPGRKRGTAVATLRIASPVDGARYVRAARSALSKTPKPLIDTFWPLATVSVMASTTAWTASDASFLLVSIRAATTSMSSALFIQVFLRRSPGGHRWRVHAQAQVTPGPGNTLGRTREECGTGTLEICHEISTLQRDAHVVQSFEQAPAHVVIDLERRDELAHRD